MRSARIALHLPDLPPLSACNVCLRIYLLSASVRHRLQKPLQYTSSGVFPSPSPARRRSQSVTPPSCHISQARVSFIAVAICAAIWMAANIFYKIIQAAGIVKSKFFLSIKILCKILCIKCIVVIENISAKRAKYNYYKSVYSENSPVCLLAFFLVSSTLHMPA